jgi:hypothetical protein
MPGWRFEAVALSVQTMKTRASRPKSRVLQKALPFGEPGSRSRQLHIARKLS